MSTIDSIVNEGQNIEYFLISTLRMSEQYFALANSLTTAGGNTATIVNKMTDLENQFMVLTEVNRESVIYFLSDPTKCISRIIDSINTSMLNKYYYFLPKKLEQRIDALDANQLKIDYSSVKSDISSIQTTLATIQKSIGTLQSDSVNIKNDIVRIDDLVSDIQKNISSMQKDIDQLKKSVFGKV